jgi:drug/metabolite transporter (DMT)-like permease
MGVITNIAPYSLFGWAEQHIASSLAGVLNATTPLFTLGFAISTRTERLTLPRVLGLVLGLPASSSCPPHGTNAGLRGSLLGVGASLLASACYAASYVYARRFLTGRQLPPLVLATGQMIAGGVLLGALAQWSPPPR